MQPPTLLEASSIAELLTRSYEYAYEQGWTDGLPIIPATPEAVQQFVAASGRQAGDLVALLPPRKGRATVEVIAVNAIMAGCRPEYMPVLIAVIEAMCDPVFRIEDCGSTPGWEPVVIVNGTIVKELDFNYGQGVMRVGRQANTSIGRFVRLFLRNICGYRISPGDGDKGSIGYSFNVALAENEDWARDIGWPTFGMDLGFKHDENVVTVQSVVCISPPTYSSGSAAAGHLQQFVDVIGRTFSYWAYSGLKRGCCAAAATGMVPSNVFVSRSITDIKKPGPVLFLT